MQPRGQTGLFGGHSRYGIGEMFHEIVVGTDGSQTARRAVVLAAEIAEQFGARLHVVYGSRPVGERWEEASQAVIDEALEDPMLRNVDTQGHAIEGAAHEAILAVAEKVGADLIVVGNRGMKSPGAIPEQIAQLAPCHVMIAKTT
jgi:nucleotide-binding universal stress UspA family protein